MQCFTRGRLMRACGVAAVVGRGTRRQTKPAMRAEDNSLGRATRSCARRQGKTHGSRTCRTSVVTGTGTMAGGVLIHRGVRLFACGRTSNMAACRSDSLTSDLRPPPAPTPATITGRPRMVLTTVLDAITMFSRSTSMRDYLCSGPSRSGWLASWGTPQ